MPAGEPARTALYSLHLELGARMVPFAGYAMPVQYKDGIMAEHKATREGAGLFDVSHMGQVRLTGLPVPELAAALETLVPGDITGLAPGRMRYTQFTDAAGGILDDLMVTHAGDHLFLVVNAACKAADIAHMKANLSAKIQLTELPEQTLLALQGPRAAAGLGSLVPGVAEMPFMSARAATIAGTQVWISRSGYTGEDGFEISCAPQAGIALVRKLLALPGAAPIGLGARDSLRLEAGLCLYGHDIDRTTSPVEAGLLWSIGKRRREAGGFPGQARIQREIREGAARRRVGLLPAGGPPAREGSEILDSAGAVIGKITSGGFAPSLGKPVAMGYVPRALSAAGTQLQVMVRGKAYPAGVVGLPFVKANYYRG
jgi:aminomethyltransferase